MAANFSALASSSNADRPPLMNQMTLPNGRKRYGVSIARRSFLSIDDCGFRRSDLRFNPASAGFVDKDLQVLQFFQELFL
jgi:hypothetical protein